MKQTAVEWLVKEMVATDWWYLSQSMKEDIIEQAKEMERQQIKFFFDKGHLYSGCQFGLEECYNKIFNKDEQ
jgi:hypothetical protein